MGLCSAPLKEASVADCVLMGQLLSTPTRDKLDEFKRPGCSQTRASRQGLKLPHGAVQEANAVVSPCGCIRELILQSSEVELYVGV